MGTAGAYHQLWGEKKVQKDKENKVFGGITITESEVSICLLENMK